MKKNNKKINLSIQMFNFIAGGDWDQVKSMQDVENLLARIADAGYDGVEWCNFMLFGEYMDIAELKKIMDKLGLKTSGYHFHYWNTDSLEEDCKVAAQRCQTLGSKYLIYAMSNPASFGIGQNEENEKENEKVKWKGDEKTVYTPEQIDEWIVQADRIIAELKKACEGTGIEVLYHNHAEEFLKGSDGRYFMDSIASDANEVDVYWVAKGTDGKVSTALDYVRSRKDHIRILHMKDGLNGSVFQGEMCGWGKGTFPLSDIVDCACECGFEWIVIENDAPQNFGTTGIEDAVESAAVAKKIGLL